MKFDLTQRSVVRWLLSCIRKKRVRYIWMGTPCNSWTRARDRPGEAPPLRSNDCVMGLPSLRPHDQLKVDVGNKLMRATVLIARAALKAGLPFVIENPATSRLWLAPPMAKLLRSPRVQVVNTDYCGFGTPWRKRTSLAFANCDLSGAARHCTGRARCSYSGVPHVQLAGTNAEGKFMTLVAEPYPRELCRLCVAAFANACISRTVATLQSYV